MKWTVLSIHIPHLCIRINWRRWIQSISRLPNFERLPYASSSLVSTNCLLHTLVDFEEEYSHSHHSHDNQSCELPRSEFGDQHDVVPEVASETEIKAVSTPPETYHFTREMDKRLLDAAMILGSYGESPRLSKPRYGSLNNLPSLVRSQFYLQDFLLWFAQWGKSTRGFEMQVHREADRCHSLCQQSV